jgi:hypothetical protein
MIIIDSPFHITYSDDNNSPSHACTGMCKKVWWPIDVKGIECNQCKGVLESAIADVHFKVLRQKDRKLNVMDFDKYSKLSKEDKKIIRRYTGNKAKIGQMSIVKPKFVEKAKKEWA